MIIQVALLLFIVFVVSRIAVRFRAGDMTGREFGIWLVFWLVVATAILIPQQTDVIARMVGVERGADLLVYISVIVLFFVVFKVSVKLEKLDRTLTKIVRDDAIVHHQEPTQTKHE